MKVIILIYILSIAYFVACLYGAEEAKDVNEIDVNYTEVKLSWQDYEKINPEAKKEKPWRVFFTDQNNNIVSSPWNPGKCYPSKKHKTI